MAADWGNEHVFVYCIPCTVHRTPVTELYHSYSRKGNILKRCTGKNEQYTKRILHESK